MLGRQEARQAILDWLDASEIWTQSAVLRHLARIEDNRQLAFARSKIAAIAANPKTRDEERELARALLPSP
jgi:hypothetical protein